MHYRVVIQQPDPIDTGAGQQITQTQVAAPGKTEIAGGMQQDQGKTGSGIFQTVPDSQDLTCFRRKLLS